MRLFQILSITRILNPMILSSETVFAPLAPTISAVSSGNVSIAAAGALNVSFLRFYPEISPSGHGQIKSAQLNFLLDSQLWIVKT